MKQRLIDANSIIYIEIEPECYVAFKSDIDAQPIIDAEPVQHGKWIPDKTGNSYWICTKCGFPSEASGAFALYHYCPQCGAKMEDENASDI